VSVRTSHPLSALPRLLSAAALLFAVELGAHAQGISAHRGDRDGGAAGGTRSIQGPIIGPTGRMPEGRTRISTSSSDGGTRAATAGEDGVFIINDLEPGPDGSTIGAGKDYEVVRGSVYLGGIHWARRDYKKAADAPETCLKLSPKAPDAEQVRGTSRELRGKS
jgi:hypothetical protein